MPPPSAPKHPNITSHHTLEAWWAYIFTRKKSAVLEGVSECTHSHIHTNRQTDTKENQHNLPVGYILLLMDQYVFHCSYEWWSNSSICFVFPVFFFVICPIKLSCTPLCYAHVNLQQENNREDCWKWRQHTQPLHLTLDICEPLLSFSRSFNFLPILRLGHRKTSLGILTLLVVFAF